MLTVKQRQCNLQFLNYDCGCGQPFEVLKVDGIEGTHTKQAYKSFQRDFGLLSIDGIYGYETDTRLTQEIRLIQINIRCEKVDGLVGIETVTKLKEFQKNNNLVVDGICGIRTRNCLTNLNQPYNWSDFKHFKQSEFACDCGCGFDTIDLTLVRILEQIRSHFGDHPVIVTSGCRCQKYNDSLQGSVKGSKHVIGKAVDFYVQGVKTSELLNYTTYLMKTGILNYTYTNNTNMSGAVHIDIV